jgi:hypothetical protein
VFAPDYDASVFSSVLMFAMPLLCIIVIQHNLELETLGSLPLDVPCPNLPTAHFSPPSHTSWNLGQERNESR